MSGLCRQLFRCGALGYWSGTGGGIVPIELQRLPVLAHEFVEPLGHLLFGLSFQAGFFSSIVCRCVEAAEDLCPLVVRNSIQGRVLPVIGQITDLFDRQNRGVRHGGVQRMRDRIDLDGERFS
jgi:hypothetical protein